MRVSCVYLSPHIPEIINMPITKAMSSTSRYRSLRVEYSGEDAGGFAEGAGSSLDMRRLAYIPEYRVYNREREIERLEREKKERQWEEELNTAMKGAEERLKYVI